MDSSVEDKELVEKFTAFSKFGEGAKADTRITLTQSDRWLKQANIIDGKKVTTTDTAITFNKYRQRKMSLPEFLKFMEDLSRSKDLDFNGVKEKLANCSLPATRLVQVSEKKPGISFDTKVTPMKQAKSPKKKAEKVKKALQK